ncbi:unnamed protein product, partial [Didymodactylos carnosus]
MLQSPHSPILNVHVDRTPLNSVAATSRN